jgi:hypothetical protein
MRKITDHIANPANDRITIEVLDEPGPGGARHEYRIRVEGEEINGLSEIEQIDLRFQKGGIAEADVNGITQEVLLAIVIDRLRGFDSGPFASEDNHYALRHCEEALECLKRRTRERMQRGVEGKSVA